MLGGCMSSHLAGTVGKGDEHYMGLEVSAAQR